MGPGQGTPQELALPFSHCCYSLGWEARQLTSPLPRHARRRPGWVWGPATQPPAQSPQPTFMGARWAASSLSKGGGPFLSVWPMAGRGRVWRDPRPPPPHSAPPAGSHRAASRPVLQGLSSSLGHSFPGLGRAPGHPAPVPSHRAGVCRGWGALTARVTRAPKFCRRAASGPSRGPPRVLRVPRAGRSPQLGPAEALARRGRAGPRAGDGWAARLSSDPGRAGGLPGRGRLPEPERVRGALAGHVASSWVPTRGRGRQAGGREGTARGRPLYILPPPPRERPARTPGGAAAPRMRPRAGVWGARRAGGPGTRQGRRHLSEQPRRRQTPARRVSSGGLGQGRLCPHPGSRVSVSCRPRSGSAEHRPSSRSGDTSASDPAGQTYALRAPRSGAPGSCGGVATVGSEGLGALGSGERGSLAGLCGDPPGIRAPW